MGRATFIGFLAIIMWAALALLTKATGNVPPFQLSAMTFTIGAIVGLVVRALTPSSSKAVKVPAGVWLIGIGGLFGYHYFYFTALRNAPTVDASLIAYLWPLFIVLGSALMPGEKLRWFHVVGALMGLSGAALIITKGGSASFDPQYAYGYSMAFVCAFVWAAYSLLSRRFADVPTSIVMWFCLATAILSLICHFSMETTTWPTNSSQWLAVLGLGLMPVGAAFYAWDYGVKHGNIQALGAASYASPLLSTAALIIAGVAQATPVILLACLLITAGAVLAAKDLIFKPKSTGKP